MADRAPLAHPARFIEANSLAMRALEVLDRNGARRVRVKTPRWLGFLRPPAEFLVQLVTRIIVRSYQSTVIDRLRDLYSRRLAWCAPGDPSRRELVRARLDSQRANSRSNGRSPPSTRRSASVGAHRRTTPAWSPCTPSCSRSSPGL